MLVVTTTQHPQPPQEARAHYVAQRCGVAYVARRGSLARFFRRNPTATHVYQVGRRGDEVCDPAGRVSVHQGLFATRVSTVDHPLIRALAPSGRAGRIVDATLGLAQDALHIAGALDCEVLGAEASAPVYCLAEEGIDRLSRQSGALGAAARRITPWHGRAEDLLATLPEGGADAVFVAPMFVSPKPASPGFPLFRQMAVHDPLPEPLIAAALRVAPRVVVKVVRGEEAPPILQGAERISGRALDYLLVVR